MSGFDAYEHLKVKLNPDGTITRFIQVPVTDPNPDPNSGEPVVSKDITLDANKKTWIRIFRPTKLPSNDNTVARLPVVFFFHSGSFIHFCASNSVNVMKCSQLAKEIPSIVVSVNYRLAPEHRLPAPYEDAIDAFKLVKRKAVDPVDGEQWLRDYADLSRCYISGAGNGANIVFHSALMALDIDLKPLKIVGLIMNQPMFGANQRTRSEVRLADDPLMPLPAIDLLWELALPVGTNRDHRFCNPMADEAYKSKLGSLGRCLVTGFGGDPMIDRQQEFVKMLVTNGVRVEAMFDDLGFPGIDLIDPKRGAALLSVVKEFIV